MNVWQKGTQVPKHSVQMALAGLVLAGAIVTGRAASVSPPPLPGADIPYSYVTVDQELTEAIRFFALNLGIAADIAPGIQGRTGADIPSGLSRRAYLDHLAAAFRFVWYFDGTTLHVAPTSSVQTEVFSLENNDGMRILSALSRLGLYQPKFRHSYDLKGKVFLVSGPPSYVSDVKKTVEALEKANKTLVTVLRGSVEDPILHSLARTPDVSTGGAAGDGVALSAEAETSE